MEPLWSPVVATGGNQRQNAQGRKAQKQAKTVATGCHRLRETFHGKEGVDGSSPSEGLGKVPANRNLSVVRSLNTRTHSGHICGTGDASRRLPTSCDTTSLARHDHTDGRSPCKEGASVV